MVKKTKQSIADDGLQLFDNYKPSLHSGDYKVEFESSAEVTKPTQEKQDQDPAEQKQDPKEGL